MKILILTLGFLALAGCDSVGSGDSNKASQNDSCLSWETLLALNVKEKVYSSTYNSYRNTEPYVTEEIEGCDEISNEKLSCYFIDGSGNKIPYSFTKVDYEQQCMEESKAQTDDYTAVDANKYSETSEDLGTQSVTVEAGKFEVQVSRSTISYTSSSLKIITTTYHHSMKDRPISHQGNNGFAWVEVLEEKEEINSSGLVNSTRRELIKLVK